MSQTLTAGRRTRTKGVPAILMTKETTKQGNFPNWIKHPTPHRELTWEETFGKFYDLPPSGSQNPASLLSTAATLLSVRETVSSIPNRHKGTPVTLVVVLLRWRRGTTNGFEISTFQIHGAVRLSHPRIAVDAREMPACAHVEMLSVSPKSTILGPSR